ANSRTSVFLRGFQGSVQDADVVNPRWSIIWRCLRLNRHCSLKLYQLLAIEKHRASVVALAAILVRKFVATLAQYARVLLERKSHFDGTVNLFCTTGILAKRFGAAEALAELLARDEIDTPRSVQLLKRLVDELDPDRTYLYADRLRR